MVFNSTDRNITTTGGSGSVTLTTPVGVTGTVSVSGNVGVSGFVTISGAVSGVQSISGTVGVSQVGSPWGVSGTVVANQGAASATAWPVFTSQVVSATITGFVSVSNTVTVTGFVSVSNAVTVTGLVTLSGAVNASQGAASATGWPVYLGGASAASGYQQFSASLSNTVQNVKASSGNIYGYHFYNPNTLDAYVQIFKVTAASVTLSSTVASRTLWVPAGGAVDAQAGPLAFASGIAVAATVSASGSTANSSALLANVDYY